MPTFVVRIWLPDRPGALGSVASRIGAVRGDLVAIDILERGAGRAIDELVVELPDDHLVELLVRELHEVDGVDVEEVRKLSDGTRPDPRLAALEVAADVVSKRRGDDVIDTLLRAVHREFEATWAAVVDLDASTVVGSVGEAPAVEWVTAFAVGAETAGTSAGTGDVALSTMHASQLAVAVGRPGRPFRAVERDQLAVIATIADVRWMELSRKGSVSTHPSVI
jgi:hypothetical protein